MREPSEHYRTVTIEDSRAGFETELVADDSGITSITFYAGRAGGLPATLLESVAGWAGLPAEALSRLLGDQAYADPYDAPPPPPPAEPAAGADAASGDTPLPPGGEAGDGEAHPPSPSPAASNGRPADETIVAAIREIGVSPTKLGKHFNVRPQTAAYWLKQVRRKGLVT